MHLNFCFVFAFICWPGVFLPGDEEEEEEVDDEEEDVEVNFFTLLLAKLLSLHEARDKAVRFRVCQLVAKMMNYAADTQSIVGPQLMDSVQEVMLQRARDKVC